MDSHVGGDQYLGWGRRRIVGSLGESRESRVVLECKPDEWERGGEGEAGIAMGSAPYLEPRRLRSNCVCSSKETCRALRLAFQTTSDI